MHYRNPADAAPMITKRLQGGTWFGFAEVDIEIPKPLGKFEEIPPFIFTKQIPDEAAPQNMKDYLQRRDEKRSNGKKLLEVSPAQNLLLYASLLCWYVEHCLVIKAAHRTIDYQAKKTFT